MQKGLLIVLSGPSGTGKGTVCQEFCSRQPRLYQSISITTRPPREGEVDGVHYRFLSESEFTRLRKAGALLEWAEVYGNFYGTPREEVENARSRGLDVLLEIDTQGAMQLQKTVEDGVFIFLLPPSMVTLWQRISGRGTDSPQVIKQRYAAAYQELHRVWQYDYVVVNQDGQLDYAVERLEAILAAEKCKVKHHREFLQQLFKEGETIDLSLH